MKTKATIWLITAKSNLHVGNENTSSYGLIDKAIQRDATSNLPCINASSLKGALNEFCSVKAQLSPADRIEIFGVDKMDKKSPTQKGSHIFFDANILFLPKQSENNLFKLVTTNSILNNFIEKIKLFDKNYSATPDTLFNEFKSQYREIERIDDKDFKDLCRDEELPIIARNCLENGVSTNLWYEQVLPAETVFYTMTLTDREKNLLSEKIDNQIVQIGANATIGYGYCLFTQKQVNHESKK